MKRAALIEFLTARAAQIGDDLIQQERRAEFFEPEQRQDARRAIAAGRQGLMQRFRDIFELQAREAASPGT